MLISRTIRLAILYATFIVWLIVEFSVKQSSCNRLDSIRGDGTPCLTQRGIPLDDCPDCYTIPVKRRTRPEIPKPSINRPQEETVWESVGDVFLVVVVFIAACSWALMISIFINDRVQRQLNRRFNMMLAMRLENAFGNSRKKG